MPRTSTLGVALAALLALAGAGASQALADGPVGTDPAANIPLGSVPGACDTAPTGTDCIDAAVAGLDRARGDLGLGPYRLPGDFAALTPEQQALVLTNSDRIAYGLAPITGLTSALGADAATGVRGDADPSSSDPTFGYWTANWAGGYPNMVMAYYDWMYDDGPGSGNLDCPSASSSGCWGHRHDVLWHFDGTGTLAMGAAAGQDPSGDPGYAILLGEGSPAYRPSYTYTWSQAVADGANGGVAGTLGGSAAGGSPAGGSTSTTGGAGTTRTKPPAVATSVPRSRRHHRAARNRRRHVAAAAGRRRVVRRAARVRGAWLRIQTPAA